MSRYNVQGRRPESDLDPLTARDRTTIRSKFATFERRVLGTYLTTAGYCGPNPDGAQCINVALEWLRVWGLEGPCGNAADWDGRSIEGLRFIPAERGLHHRTGDILCFPPASSGPAGHVSVMKRYSGSWLTSLDQNWPEGSPVARTLHMANGPRGSYRLIRRSVVNGRQRHNVLSGQINLAFGAF